MFEDNWKKDEVFSFDNIFLQNTVEVEHSTEDVICKSLEDNIFSYYNS